MTPKHSNNPYKYVIHQSYIGETSLSMMSLYTLPPMVHRCGKFVPFGLAHKEPLGHGVLFESPGVHLQPERSKF